MTSFRQLRTALWHLRRGGPAQLTQWRLRRKAGAGILIPKNIRGSEGGWSGRGKRRRLTFHPYELPTFEPRRKDLRVAVILDDFSALAFAYEWDLVALQRTAWRQQLETAQVDFLFVESAWKGNGASWQYQLTGESGPKAEFVALMEYCRSSGIPTVFWNKEDPPHFDDFLPAARLFDAVFTSDVNKISEYRKCLGHDRVDVLPFAAQPAIHHPVRPGHGFQARDVAFAGMYFAHKYPERRRQMDFLLGGAMDASVTESSLGLEIFSRMLGGPPEYQFPGEFGSRVVGSLDYQQMLTAYRAYKVFLNVNSVVDSPSMCARRIFEISAAGGAVVTAPSTAVTKYFGGDEVFVAESREQASAQVKMLVKSPELRQRAVHKAQRRIWNEHTYAHRAERVTAAVLPDRVRSVAPPSVSAIVSTVRPAQLKQVLASVGRQAGVDMELVLLTHGFETDFSTLRRQAAEAGIGNVVLLSAGREVSLGECLNRAVEASSGDVLSKMDDDDYYGSNYMRDLLNALAFSRASVVGKQAHYMHFLSHGATLLRSPHKEHRYNHMVAGPTITAQRAVFEAAPFEDVRRGEDTAFLAAVLRQGGSVYSADRFNFCQVRSRSGHTWDPSEEGLMASGVINLFGDPVAHVTV
ncbi:glycosyltransferase [Pseudarthrobacter sp. J75]|uniref:glycosyltransferase family protein n=1 Tax=Pseudarthrobacter sp. J75 TaxID=3116486 RepID=UPI002E80884B|nr:glycosyltransferase [Pseudarthrobacter sp. J75]MEE2528796.1 glycosyltransferase [Pseudarthrobacter sp. J75]